MKKNVPWQQGWPNLGYAVTPWGKWHLNGHLKDRWEVWKRRERVRGRGFRQGRQCTENLGSWKIPDKSEAQKTREDTLEWPPSCSSPLPCPFGPTPLCRSWSMSFSCHVPARAMGAPFLSVLLIWTKVTLLMRVIVLERHHHDMPD